MHACMAAWGDKRADRRRQRFACIMANTRDADQDSGNQAVREIKNNTTQYYQHMGTHMDTRAAEGQLARKRKGSLEGDEGLGLLRAKLTYKVARLETALVGGSAARQASSCCPSGWFWPACSLHSLTANLPAKLAGALGTDLTCHFGPAA